VRLDLPEQARRVLQDRRVLRVLRVRPELPEQARRVLQDHRVLPALQALPELPEQARRVLPDYKGLLVRPARLDLLVLPDLKVQHLLL